MAAEIITRANALAQGLKRYWTGKPCKRGSHIAERLCSNGNCLACVKEGEPERSRRRYADNPEKTQERSKRWAERNPEKVKANSQRWREANPEKWRESNRRSKQANQQKYTDAQRDDYAGNPEKYKAAWKRYYENKRERHIERAAERWRTRRAQMLGSGGTHTAADVAAILIAQNYRCPYCDADLRQVKQHIDHIMPLSKGGSNDKVNIQILDATCNLKKGDKDPLAYARSIGLLL